MLSYPKMLSLCVACSYPVEVTCAHDCSLELRSAGIRLPCPCYWTPSKEGGHIQPACWAWSPVPLITETQPALSMWVWPHSSDPRPSRTRSLSSLESTWCQQHLLNGSLCPDTDLRHSLPLHLVLPYLLPSLWGSTNGFIFFNIIYVVKGVCHLASFLSWFEIRSILVKGRVILKRFFMASLLHICFQFKNGKWKH